MAGATITREEPGVIQRVVNVGETVLDADKARKAAGRGVA